MNHSPITNNPLPPGMLETYKEKATLGSLNLYKQKVGSVLYVALVSRPDVAFATSHLSQFLSNPGPAHRTAVNQLMAYLWDTKDNAIEYDGHLGTPEILTCATDASFADNHDETSTARYVIASNRGAIDWRSLKQRHVTPSTTEAEFHALISEARELQCTNISFLTSPPLDQHHSM